MIGGLFLHRLCDETMIFLFQYPSSSVIILSAYLGWSYIITSALGAWPMILFPQIELFTRVKLHVEMKNLKNEIVNLFFKLLHRYAWRLEYISKELFRSIMSISNGKSQLFKNDLGVTRGPKAIFAHLRIGFLQWWSILHLCLKKSPTFESLNSCADVLSLFPYYLPKRKERGPSLLVTFDTHRYSRNVSSNSKKLEIFTSHNA